MDIATLAATITGSFLLPYFKLGVEKLIEGAGKKFGEKAAEHTGKIAHSVVDRVAHQFESGSDKTALQLFRENPDEMEPMIRKLLATKLEANAELTKELTELVNSPSPDGSGSGAQIMGATIAGILDARNQNLTNARNVTQAGVIVGQPPK
jgi:hypothetical protein